MSKLKIEYMSTDELKPYERNAKMIDRDQNDLLQYMQTGDKHGQEAFCFGGYIFKKENIAAAQMSEPEY